MTAQDERLVRLQAASDSIKEELADALSEQGKKAAANMLQLYGSKTVLDAGGFIYAIQNAHEAALLFLLEEEYVTLNEKGLATPEKIAERVAKRAEALTDEDRPKARAAADPANRFGAYL